MKRILAATILSLGLAFPASADTLDELFANTLTLTDANGRVTTLLVSADGSMEQANPAGMWAAGFWAKEDSRFCWTARGAAKLCMPLESGKAVGDSWDIAGPTGQKVWTAEIVAGRTNLKELSEDVP